MWQQAHPKIKVASLLKNVNPQKSNGMISTLAFLLGAVAFGLWQQSFAAALFAGGLVAWRWYRAIAKRAPSAGSIERDLFTEA